MATDFRTTRVRFDSTRGIVQRETGSVNFRSRVRRAGFAINGFKMKFTDKDHHLWHEEINIEESNIQISNTNVSFPVSFLLRDSSGNIDDRYEGYVDVLVIAEVD